MQTMSNFYTIIPGSSPLIATAIHDGHDVRDDLLDRMKLGDEGRLREEDPYTGEMSKVTDNRVIVHTSRFEVDLNRAREKAVYRLPEDAWGLEVWKEGPTDEQVAASLEKYDTFTRSVFTLIDGLLKSHDRLVIYDLHSYNHRRDGAEAEPADPEKNPEINVGTDNNNQVIFRPVIDRFIAEMSEQEFRGEKLDVRENVKFKGGDFSRRIYERYPDRVCTIAVEFKKIFMDEWTGLPYDGAVEEMRRALEGTVEGVLESL